jgi:hypothetical protein
LWYWLQFSDGSLFGYYTYQTTQGGWIYHNEMGWEWCDDASTAANPGAIYFWDNASTDWFWTGPSLFPLLTVTSTGPLAGHWLWYYPDPNNPGHYTSNPRLFWDFNYNNGPNQPQGAEVELNSDGSETAIGRPTANSVSITRGTGTATLTLYYNDPVAGAASIAYGKVYLVANGAVQSSLSWNQSGVAQDSGSQCTLASGGAPSYPSNPGGSVTVTFTLNNCGNIGAYQVQSEVADVNELYSSVATLWPPTYSDGPTISATATDAWGDFYIEETDEPPSQCDESCLESTQVYLQITGDAYVSQEFDAGGFPGYSFTAGASGGTYTASLTVCGTYCYYAWNLNEGDCVTSNEAGFSYSPPAPAPPTVQVTNGGTAVQPGSTVYITSTPSLPLVASLVPGHGGSLTGNVTWGMQIQYLAQDGYVYSYQTSATQAANSTWDIGSAFNGNFAGGSAVVTATYQGLPLSLSFTILGQNPSVAVLKSAIGTSPWYLQQLAKYESGYRQFDTNGNPVYGYPHGFGVMMDDFKHSVYDMWTWTTNISDGQANDASNATPAITAWAGQVGAWLAYNASQAAQGLPQVPMYAELSYGPDPTLEFGSNQCVFAYTPWGGQYPFSDGIRIKLYNTGPSGTPFITFDPVNGWKPNDSVNYVLRVCSENP